MLILVQKTLKFSFQCSCRVFKNSWNMCIMDKLCINLEIFFTKISLFFHSIFPGNFWSTLVFKCPVSTSALHNHLTPFLYFLVAGNAYFSQCRKSMLGHPAHSLGWVSLCLMPELLLLWAWDGLTQKTNRKYMFCLYDGRQRLWVRVGGRGGN